jgi:nucleotide-binding universal stress UspA family protein
MQNLVEKIENRIASGAIPQVSYSTALVEGLPEEEIITYSKKIRPTAIVMGTRGKNAKELDLIAA